MTARTAMLGFLLLAFGGREARCGVFSEQAFDKLWKWPYSSPEPEGTRSNIDTVGQLLVDKRISQDELQQCRKPEIDIERGLALFRCGGRKLFGLGALEATFRGIEFFENYWHEFYLKKNGAFIDSDDFEAALDILRGSVKCGGTRRHPSEIGDAKRVDQCLRDLRDITLWTNYWRDYPQFIRSSDQKLTMNMPGHSTSIDIRILEDMGYSQFAGSGDQLISARKKDGGNLDLAGSGRLELMRDFIQAIQPALLQEKLEVRKALGAVNVEGLSAQEAKQLREERAALDERLADKRREMASNSEYYQRFIEAATRVAVKMVDVAEQERRKTEQERRKTKQALEKGTRDGAQARDNLFGWIKDRFGRGDMNESDLAARVRDIFDVGVK